MKKESLILIRVSNAVFVLFLCGLTLTESLSAKSLSGPALSARSAAVLDVSNGVLLYGKNPHLRLPPASTAKVMTALVVLERLKLDAQVAVSPRAAAVSPSRAGLTAGAWYRASDLLTAVLVSSSNDAAVALAEAAAGSEGAFAGLMNEKAKKLGMKNTRFVNATGLPGPKKKKQYSTAYDLTRLMIYASRDRRIDQAMGILETWIRGSDGKRIPIRSHNKMLWRTPKFIKGKTGWTFRSKHTFVGTNYASQKIIVFALLCSERPWVDIEKLASFGLFLKSRLRR